MSDHWTDRAGDLADHGVDRALIAAALVEPHTVGADRNSAADVCGEILERIDRDLDDPLAALERRGGYLTALARGHVADAFARADGSNSRIMCAAFGEPYIRACNAYEHAMMNSALDERFERYGGGDQ